MSTKIEDSLDQAEANVLKTYARTNRDGPITCTTAAGWNTTTGAVTGITLTMGSATKTLTFNADSLIGRHLHDGTDTARRITDNAATASNSTTLTTEAWSTAVSAAAGREIRDGFHKCPDDKLLAASPQDRHFQIVFGDLERVSSFGNAGLGRYDMPFNVEVCYESTPQQRHRARMRAAEDAQAITNAMLEDGNQPSGVTFYETGSMETIVDEERFFVVAIPFRANFTDSSVES